MKPILKETYKGYKIYYRPGTKRRPWRCEVPGRPGRHADRRTLEDCKFLIRRMI